ncbi:ntP-ppase-like protein [Caudoviricetes sp.]|nr:ntP-ppase-like protein [Caudoviricetes sp.]
MTIHSIAQWHERARPDPINENFQVQLGCHFEEIHEMLDALECNDPHLLQDAMEAMNTLAVLLKSGAIGMTITNRKEFLDGLADQVVTAVGTGHCAKMDMRRAVTEVDRSNWSKYDEEGNPIFNENGKIMKGPSYTPPNLEGMY